MPHILLEVLHMYGMFPIILLIVRVMNRKLKWIDTNKYTILFACNVALDVTSF